MTRFILFAALFFATLAALTIFVMSGSSARRVTLAEDDPGWNCHTMGNGVCGPVLEDARFLKYDRLFDCFAEVNYNDPKLPWNSKVLRCIPPVAQD